MIDKVANLWLHLILLEATISPHSLSIGNEYLMQPTRVGNYVNMSSFNQKSSETLNLEVAFLWLHKCNFVKVQKMHTSKDAY